jgi:hypothetical protein
MATLATQEIVQAGLAITAGEVTAGASGDKFVPGDGVFLRVTNGDSNPTNVTVTAPVTNPHSHYTKVDPVGSEGPHSTEAQASQLADLVVAVAAGITKLIGPLPANDWANPADSNLGLVTCSNKTAVKVSAIHV